MPADLNETQLRAAWEIMRKRRSLAHWPCSFAEVMADRRRGALVRLEAQAAIRSEARSAARRVPLTNPPRCDPTSPPNHRQPIPGLDRKRAAAGDRDD